jgi:hypothetical protein
MVSGMHNDFVFVVRGSEFQKMHVEFYVNILLRACSTQESDENVNFLDNFLAHLQDQYFWK